MSFRRSLRPRNLLKGWMQVDSSLCLEWCKIHHWGWEGTCDEVVCVVLDFSHSSDVGRVWVRNDRGCIFISFGIIEGLLLSFRRSLRPRNLQKGWMQVDSSPCLEWRKNTIVVLRGSAMMKSVGKMIFSNIILKGTKKPPKTWLSILIKEYYLNSQPFLYSFVTHSLALS